MMISGKKTTRLMNELVDYLRRNTVVINLKIKYDRRLGRDTFSTGREFVVPEKMVDQLIQTCEDLQLDLTTSDIKDSRGYQVFFPDGHKF